MKDVRKKLSPIRPLISDDEYHAHSMEGKQEESLDMVDMMSLLLTRLTQIEKENQIMKISMKNREKKIQELENSVSELQRLVRDTPSQASSSCSHYDLNHEFATIPPMALNTPIPPINAHQDGGGGFPFNIAQIKASINTLNIDAGMAIKKDNSGAHSFKNIKPLFLAIYKDGIFFMNGPFRSFQNDPSAASFCRDLQDGYYPFELKNQYPNGCPFDFHDFTRENRTETHQMPPANSSLHKITKKDPAKALLENINRYYIKQGKVVDLHDGLIPSNSPVKQNKIIKITNEAIKSSKNFAIIRIKDNDTSDIFEIPVRHVEKLEDLIESMGKDSSKFDLYLATSRYPLNLKSTISQSKLYPKCFLHLKKRGKH